MIDAFKALPSQPEIYLCYPSKAYLTGESINDDIISKEIIPMIKKVAKKNKLPVIDLHSAMDGMPELFPDHIHPKETKEQTGINQPKRDFLSVVRIIHTSFCCVIQDNQLFLFPNLE